MSTYQPYFYIVGWKALDWCYAGIEFKNGRNVANPQNLFRDPKQGYRYATSSERVKKLVGFFGDPEVLEIHVCDTAEQAIELEREFLNEALVPFNPRWLNANVGGGFVQNPISIAKTASKIRGQKRSLESRAKMSKAAKGRPAWNKGVPSPRLGKTLPASHCANIRAAKAANPQIVTDEAKAKLRASKGSLSREVALAVLNAEGTPTAIAERFGVIRDVVYRIKAGKHWICTEA